MVHQEFTLVPSFTAPENIGLGQEPKNSKGLIDWKGLNKLVVDIAEKYGFKVDPGLKMIDASVGVQQRTEILKTLYRNANILILDEPTAVLTPQETDELFTVIFPKTCWRNIKTCYSSSWFTAIIFNLKLYFVNLTNFHIYNIRFRFNEISKYIR